MREMARLRNKAMKKMANKGKSAQVAKKAEEKGPIRVRRRRLKIARGKVHIKEGPTRATLNRTHRANRRPMARKAAVAVRMKGNFSKKEVADKLSSREGPWRAT